MRTDCCVVGCGPAGAMLGLMLARMGIDVIVLEKHKDFLRDFRGDDISPGTVEILGELGLAEDFLSLKPKRIDTIRAHTPAGAIILADLQRIRTPFPFYAVIPQWDFLDFVTKEASREKSFQLLLGTEATGLLESGGEINGVRCQSEQGELTIRARLTVAADGRYSTTRMHAGLRLLTTAPPIDLLWFRLPRAGQPSEAAISIHLGGGQVMARIDRDSYWQVACVISKGSAQDVVDAGIETFRGALSRCMPDLAESAAALRGWDQVSQLSVQTNRLRRWYRPGLICIGDAAHAMSPIGGAGINFAIADAVAVANRLGDPLRRGEVPVRALRAVQRERSWQVRFMQALQAQLTTAVLVSADADPHGLRAFAQRTGPRLANLWPFLGIRSRITALGLRRSHLSGLAKTAARLPSQQR
jgi:2-polyprenyl-6-methoxyphenol hydroxylase-like FAD-dependent oxidoreductase